MKNHGRARLEVGRGSVRAADDLPTWLEGGRSLSRGRPCNPGSDGASPYLEPSPYPKSSLKHSKPLFRETILLLSSFCRLVLRILHYVFKQTGNTIRPE